jgi:hypothetical protein
VKGRSRLCEDRKIFDMLEYEVLIASGSYNKYLMPPRSLETGRACAAIDADVPVSAKLT